VRRGFSLRPARNFLILRRTRLQSEAEGWRRNNVLPVNFVPKAVRRLWEVRHHCSFDNIYHCCVQKTASQWVRRILSDRKTVYRYSGLEAFHTESAMAGGVDMRRLDERTFDAPFAKRTIVTPLYLSLECMRGIPKPPRWKAFFVMRDPRDIIVSRYFSFKISHRVIGNIGDLRERLAGMSEAEGLNFVIDELDRRGLFAALRSWSRLPAANDEAPVFRYEDLIGPAQLNHFQRLFEACDLRLPEAAARDVLERNSFAARSGGRAPGIEDVSSHLRKGVAGDWKNHFVPEVERHFRQVTGTLIDELGYTW
jgi:hypothetical protein